MPPKRRRKVEAGNELVEAFRLVGERLNQFADKPNIHGYEPHAKQELFHKSDHHIRAYLGGNRSGKTYSAVAEGVWWSSKTHPYKTMPHRPVRGRVVAVDLNMGVGQIILPLYAHLIPPSMLINGSWEDSYNASTRILTFDNDSTIEFMSYEMDVEKFAGTSRDWVHYDEEPPKPIFQECQARLVDTGGSAWISMTPVQGMTWVYEDIYLKGVVNKDPDILVIEVDTTENPHIGRKELDRYMAGLSEDEKLARLQGRFVPKGGRVFPRFDAITHTIESFLPPKGWEITASVDHGWRNPTAWLWHAVDPDTGNVVTFAEHYESQMTVEEHSVAVLALEDRLGISDRFIYRTGDPAMKQENAVTGTSIIREYQDHGIFVNVETVPRRVAPGLNKMQQYFDLANGGPRWKISRDCPNFIKEMEQLRWKTYSSKKLDFERNKPEEVHDKDDHTFDSARYFATHLPDLTPPKEGDSGIVLPNRKLVRYDEALAQSIAREKMHNAGGIEWKVLEEY